MERLHITNQHFSARCAKRCWSDEVITDKTNSSTFHFEQTKIPNRKIKTISYWKCTITFVNSSSIQDLLTFRFTFSNWHTLSQQTILFYSVHRESWRYDSVRCLRKKLIHYYADCEFVQQISTKHITNTQSDVNERHN